MITLTLPDMSCGHCVRTVTELLHRLDPQGQVSTDLAKRTAQFTTTVPEATLRAALAEAGYPAQA